MLQSSKLGLLCKDGFKICVGVESGVWKSSWHSGHHSKYKHISKRCLPLKMTTISNGQHDFQCGHFGSGLPGYESNLSSITIILWTDTHSKYLLSSRHCLYGAVNNVNWLCRRGAQIGINPSLTLSAWLSHRTTWVSFPVLPLTSCDFGQIIKLLHAFLIYLMRMAELL